MKKIPSSFSVCPSLFLSYADTEFQNRLSESEAPPFHYLSPQGLRILTNLLGLSKTAN